NRAVSPHAENEIRYGIHQRAGLFLALTQRPLRPQALGNVDSRTEDRRLAVELDACCAAIEPAGFSLLGYNWEFVPHRHGSTFLPAQAPRSDDLALVRVDHVPEILPQEFRRGVTKDLLRRWIQIEEFAILMDEDNSWQGFGKGEE